MDRHFLWLRCVLFIFKFRGLAQEDLLRLTFIYLKRCGTWRLVLRCSNCTISLGMLLCSFRSAFFCHCFIHSLATFSLRRSSVFHYHFQLNSHKCCSLSRVEERLMTLCLIRLERCLATFFFVSSMTKDFCERRNSYWSVCPCNCTNVKPRSLRIGIACFTPSYVPLEG